jgi:hypothetical protein
LIAQHSSAKEIIMAVQEIVECLRTDDSDSGDDGDGESGGVRLVLQLIRLQSLLAKSMFDQRTSLFTTNFSYLAFPRLVLRKSPSQTLVLLAELRQLLSPAARHAKVAEARSLVRNAALMVQELGVWAKGKAGDNISELNASHVSKDLPSQQRIQLEFTTGPSGILPECCFGSEC